MARGINKVILIGNCGGDPDCRFMPNGNAVTNITLATSESWKDKQTGQQQERTEWHRIIFFNRLGEVAGEYLRKGSKVYIEGSLRTREWEKDGVKRYTTEIIASEMQMLDSRNNQQQQPQQAPAPACDDKIIALQQHQARSAALLQPAVPANPATQQVQPQQQNKPTSGNFDDFDDDIPF